MITSETIDKAENFLQRKLALFIGLLIIIFTLLASNIKLTNKVDGMEAKYQHKADSIATAYRHDLYLKDSINNACNNEKRIIMENATKAAIQSKDEFKELYYRVAKISEKVYKKNPE